MPNILIIDDNLDICTLLKRYLEKKKYTIQIAHSGKTGISLFKKEKFDLVLCDFRLPDVDGIEMISALKALNQSVEIIIITGYSDVKMAVQVMKKGAFEYVTKPIHPEEILHSIKSALNNKATNAKEASVAIEKKKVNAAMNQGYVKGNSLHSQQIQKLITLVAPTDMTVVITGQSGTGKEVTAKAIHAESKRSKGRIVAVDCGAIPHELAGSVLFGHVKGSFTGALADKIGHFEAANAGTLFLDEIGNLSYENQIKLLRVLQERKIQRIGENKERPIDVRIIVATNENLKEKVEKGEFREDLYYRLNEFNIQMPSLMERREDLMSFADFLLAQASSELGKQMSGFNKKVITAFLNYNWPGNIRELKNVIKRACLLSTGTKVDFQAIPTEIGMYETTHIGGDEGELTGLKSIVETAEKKAIINTLKLTGYNKSKAAKSLKIDRKTLYNKIQAYNIQLPD